MQNFQRRFAWIRVKLTTESRSFIVKFHTIRGTLLFLSLSLSLSYESIDRLSLVVRSCWKFFLLLRGSSTMICSPRFATSYKWAKKQCRRFCVEMIVDKDFINVDGTRMASSARDNRKFYANQNIAPLT